jgi:hypothetical protein
VWRRPGGYVLVCDEFSGEGQHDIEVVYQFAPGALTMAPGDRIVYEGVCRARMDREHDMDARYPLRRSPCRRRVDLSESGRS